MKPKRPHAAHEPRDIRKELRTFRIALQNDYFRFLGKEPEALVRLDKQAFDELRELARRMEEKRQEQGPDWKDRHGRVLDRLRKLGDKPRRRRLEFEPNYPDLRPRPQPEDYFEEPMEDLPDLGGGIGGDGALCRVTTTRIDATANHGETITISPSGAEGAKTLVAFDVTPGVNEVKMAVGVQNRSRTEDVAISAEASWRFDYHPPADGLYTIRPLIFLSGMWLLWANPPGVASSTGSVNVKTRVRVSQFDGPTLYEAAEDQVLDVAVTDNDLDGDINYDSVSGRPLEVAVQLAKDLRTHIIVTCAVSVRLAGLGLAGVDLKDKFYFRVPEVQIDRFTCPERQPRPRISVSPLVVAMRKNDQFRIQIDAAPPFDGAVQLSSSNTSAASVSSNASLSEGNGSAIVIGKQEGREVFVSVRAPGYQDGRAIVHIENSAGIWEELPTIPDFVAVHAAVLRTGKVLMFSASHRTHDDITDPDKGKSFLLDCSDGARTEVPIARNLFCAGHCFLRDGRLLVAGGQNLWQLSARITAAFFGGAGADLDVHTFDPISESWTRHADMAEKRWYPTCVTLPDGRGLIVGGTRYGNDFFNNIEFNSTREIFAPGNNSLSAPSHFRNNLLYPFLQVLPGNRLFVHRKRNAELFDLGADDWLRAPTGERLSFRTNHDGTRTYPGSGCCVPLTIDAENPDRMGILVIGGSEVTDPAEDSETTASVELFDYRRDEPAASRWRNTPAPLPDRRFMGDGVLLADGTVFVTNGAGTGKADHNAGDRKASYIFDPVNSVWLPVDDSPVARSYHSIALLLPDARVIVGGSTGHEFTNREDEFRLHVFTPPYLTRGPRPVIADAPDAIGYGAEFDIRVGTARANQIGEVALLRPGSTTHTVNMDQRRIRLPIRERSGSTVRVGSPSDTAVAPKGFYMLFVLNHYGVPSVATFVQLE